MHFKLSLPLLALSAQAAVLRRPETPRRFCGARDFVQELDGRKEQQVAEAIADGNVDELFGRAQTVLVNFHSIQGDNTTGFVTDKMIADQIQVLNDDYKSFTFKLNHTTRTIDRSIFYPGYDSRAETKMKKSLRMGDATTLNVYTASLSGGLLGWATFPTDLESRPWRDGVVVHYATLPGGSSAPYDKGRTLTHEAGHWHTFQDGCSYPNDFVEDTIPERGPAFGCPAPRKTCRMRNFPRSDQGTFNATDASEDKMDPTRNFMDYVEDGCMDHFTKGQYTRMKAMWSTRKDFDGSFETILEEVEEEVADSDDDNDDDSTDSDDDNDDDTDDDESSDSPEDEESTAEPKFEEIVI